MKRNIHSLAQLKIEIARLSTEKHLQERKLNTYVKDFSQALKPANLIRNIFSSITGNGDLKGLLKSKGTEAALGFVVTQLLFKNANPLVRTAATVLGTSFASSIFGEDSAKYVEKIKSLYQKFRNKKTVADPDSFNEGDNYIG